MVLWPRHFIAAMPLTQRTPLEVLSSSQEAEPCWCGQRDEGLSCRQHGMSHPGFPVQQEAARRLGTGLPLFEQQQPPLWQYSSLMQPHAAAVVAPAGMGTPNAVSK